MSYLVTIGIEIHCELKTKTKMFSSAPVTFGALANSATTPIDLGHPGTLPCVNAQAVALAIKACAATHCTIDPLIKFDRKNYYYSDLAKGFQITQQFHPIGRDGYVSIVVDGQEKKIGLERIHMEEDTAKQFHKETGTYMDFNRAGVPLIEIVSRPDMHSASEAAAYVEALRQMLFYLNVSDVKMEEGSMRCDVNISLSKDANQLGTKVEIKNLNSIANVQKAVAAEIERQTALLEAGQVVEQATRRYDEAQKTTVLMRKKEGAVDYKYFPEPNIFPIQLDQTWIDDIVLHMEELPQARTKRLMTEYGLGEYESSVLVADKDMVDYFEQAAKLTKAYQRLANLVMTDVRASVNKDGLSWLALPVAPLSSLVSLIEEKTLSTKQGKSLLAEVLAGHDPKQLMKEKGIEQVSDESALMAMIETVLDQNEQSIVDYKNGKDRALGYLVGQVMKASRGQANPQLTNQLLKAALDKR